MRCWTRSELDSVLECAGFGSVAYFGAYDPAVSSGATDRLVAVAQLSDVSSSIRQLADSDVDAGVATNSEDRSTHEAR